MEFPTEEEIIEEVEELKAHYGSTKSKSSTKESSKGRKKLSGDSSGGGRVKKVLGRIKSFGRNK